MNEENDTKIEHSFVFIVRDYVEREKIFIIYFFYSFKKKAVDIMVKLVSSIQIIY
jgi:hypothetical protein